MTFEKEIWAAIIGAAAAFASSGLIAMVAYKSQRRSDTVAIEASNRERRTYFKDEVDRTIFATKQIRYSIGSTALTLYELISKSGGSALLGASEAVDIDKLLYFLRFTSEKNLNRSNVNYEMQKMRADCLSLNILVRKDWVTEMYSGADYVFSDFGAAVCKRIVLRETGADS